MRIWHSKGVQLAVGPVETIKKNYISGIEGNSMRKVQTAIQGILNIFVAGLSLFFSVIIIMYIYTSLTPSKAMGIAFKPGFTEIIIALILLGSTFYYFKSGQQTMKIVSSIGCISMFATLMIVYLS